MAKTGRAFSEAGQSFYAQNQGAPSGGGGPTTGEAGATGTTSGTGTGQPEEVVEADYEIVDESKK